MSVGIMDGDATSLSNVMFHLEAMKLATYYKRKGEIVIPCFVFAPQKHTHFVYCKDYDNGFTPPTLLLHSNVDYYGLLFSGGVYNPLPEEIECLKADTSIYANMGNFFEKEQNWVWAYGGVLEQGQSDYFGSMMAAEHIRLSLDGATVWPQYQKQLDFEYQKPHTIILHDPNLASIAGAREALLDILKHYPSSVRLGVKFPIVITNSTEVRQWIDLPFGIDFFEMLYQGFLPLDELDSWLDVAAIDKRFSQIRYNITLPQYDENFFTQKILPIVYYEAIYARSRGAFFRLIYDKKIFTDKRWLDVMWLLDVFLAYSRRHLEYFYEDINNATMHNYAQRVAHAPEMENQTAWLNRIYQAVDFVRKANPFLHQMFSGITPELESEVKKLWKTIT